MDAGAGMMIVDGFWSSQRMLRLWEKDLNDRPEDERRSTQGKYAAATQMQTRKNLKPLFKLLKAKVSRLVVRGSPLLMNQLVLIRMSCCLVFRLQNVPSDILGHLTKIVDFCRERNYVKANESYLEMAIGNAAWPMGVTMVGIHERAGREKIFSQHTAHVLNDENQRKYIQGVKRLMTYAQKKVTVTTRRH